MKKPVFIAAVAESMAIHSEREALVIEDRVYTYAELRNVTASVLDVISRYAGDVVAVMAENTVYAYASLLASLFSGKTYVVLLPSYPDERKKSILEKSGACLLLHSGISDTGFAEECGVPVADISGGSMDTEIEVVPSDRNAYIIFTSGSTGEPKGVPVSRENLDAFYFAYGSLGWDLDKRDRMLQMFELSFDVSVVSFLYPLSLGASVYTVPSEGMKYFRVLDLMERYSLTFAAIAPSVLRLSRAYFGEMHFPSLRYLVVTAEASEDSLLQEFRQCIPNAEIVNLYGPSEATIYCTAYKVPAHDCRHCNGIVSIGYPFVCVDVIVVGDDGLPVPDGDVGELLLSGPQVMKGYLDAGNDKGAFFTDAGGKRYYRTGDLCRREADGLLLYCGRKDSQVKINGFRVELGEIEHKAREFFGNGCHVAVIPFYRDGICELHLAVEGKDRDCSGLGSHLSSTLPPYMLPKGIHCLDSFPLNANGKTDRKKIAGWISASI